MGAVPGNFRGGDFQGVPSEFPVEEQSEVVAFTRALPASSRALVPAQTGGETKAPHQGRDDTDFEVSPQSRVSVSQFPSFLPFSSEFESGDEGQVLFQLVPRGSRVRESQEEKQRNPGEILRTPPRTLSPPSRSQKSGATECEAFVTEMPEVLISFERLDDWSSKTDWLVQQHGQTLGDHGVLLEGHEQKLAFLAGEVGRNNQKVNLLEGEVESRLVENFHARFKAMHKERQELQG